MVFVNNACAAIGPFLSTHVKGRRISLLNYGKRQACLNLITVIPIKQKKQLKISHKFQGLCEYTYDG